MLKAMKINVTLPIVVNVDNMGTVFTSKNTNTTGCSKHIDIRKKYVNEYVEDGVLKIVYAKSEENDVEIFTTNLGNQLHGKHAVKYVGEVENAVVCNKRQHQNIRKDVKWYPSFVRREELRQDSWQNNSIPPSSSSSSSSYDSTSWSWSLL